MRTVRLSKRSKWVINVTPPVTLPFTQCSINIHTQVKIIDKVSKEQSQANEKDTETHCSSSTVTTTGTDSAEIKCDPNLSATEVTIRYKGSDFTTKLAEVVVVGFSWGKQFTEKCFTFIRKISISN